MKAMLVKILLAIKWFFIRLWYRRFTRRSTYRMLFGENRNDGRGLQWKKYPFQAGDVARHATGSESLYLGNTRWLQLIGSDDDPERKRPQLVQVGK